MPDRSEDSVFVPEKAYKNIEFLNSASARPIRILCEYEEPRQRLHRCGVDNTVAVFGSARAAPGDEARAALELARANAAAKTGDRALGEAVKRAEAGLRLSRFYDDAREFSRRITEWNLGRETGPAYLIASGGGPGIMEAANRGASDVPGGRSVGLGISLPFEAGVNAWVTPELAFEFHYFFTRKYWFLYLAEALVVFPGGYGTLDELFESLTLIQTGKMQSMPIVLYGSEYWNAMIEQLEMMKRYGTLSLHDTDLFHVSDEIEDAVSYVVGGLEAREAEPTP